MRLAFDIETDGLLDEMTLVHCLVLEDIDSDRVWECYRGGPMSIPEGLQMVQEADLVVPHGGIKFDAPALQKVFPKFSVDEPKLFDTLVASRLIYSNLQETDGAYVEKGQLPSKLFGSHSLAAWGHRLGEYKDDYPTKFKEWLETQGIPYVESLEWKMWNPHIVPYCRQDVKVTKTLFKHLESKNYSQRALDFEHQVAWRCALMERSGWPFDEKAASELYGELVAKREAIRLEMARTFEPLVIERVSEKTGKPLKPKTIEFNPGSRDQIAQRLTTKYGWKPTEFTPAGKPKVDEDVLKKLKYPEAQTLAEYFLLEKRVGQLSEGKQGWLKVVRNGRIHCSVNTNGAVTGRATHQRPNLSQVPAVRSPYGKECRSLFTVLPGFSEVGCDLSGLELRCLAHFMSKWDGGEYANEVLNGDVHTKNQLAAGLPTRDNAKTFAYGFLYGAGDQKLGEIVGKGRLEGKRLKEKFLKSLPALKKLREAVTKAAERGHLVGLDGRHIPVRSPHSALNTLLQSAGALIAKRWLLEIFWEAEKRGHRYGWNADWTLLGWSHDEVQIAAKDGVADEFGVFVVECAAKAGEHFSFRCPIGAEYKVGRNWADCH
jgi:DNA polymerase I-like protein with 3'-5' exonuclease and polymerase domains